MILEDLPMERIGTTIEAREIKAYMEGTINKQTCA
jgi:hypothetical protein